ncbi:MAG: helix-turn-helix domain-containing protein [Clostridia bacterium]|nr:helix-turn-helix domain-containing protein [Clostridia bacterium]
MNTEINLSKINENIKLKLIKETVNYIKEKSKFEDAHIHNCYEIYVNIHGDVSFLVESNLYHIKRGDIVITTPNEMHHCVYNSSCIHDCYCLWFKFDNISSDISQFLENRIRGRNNLISMNSIDKKSAMDILKSMSQKIRNNQTDTSSFMALLYSFFDIIQRYKGNIDSTNMPELLGNILAYIEENLSCKCSANDVSKHFYIGRSTLYRLFNQHLGITPARYIEDKRLSLAKKLISEKMSLKEVYSACGFNDYSHFIYVFRKKFGITPYKYIKSMG